jgi:two-component system, cell cycle sensor histidine kinase and response regulator CckA
VVTQEQQTLLIVDDNESNRDLLSRRLERKEFVVATASDGKQALDLVENRQFDLILLDLMMQGMSGLEVLERLRQNFTASELPIIMVTAHHDNSAVVGCLELGANDYVTKPVDIPVLLARIHAQLGRKRAEEALKQANRGLEHEVEQRTAELRHANDSLRTEIGDRIQAEERVRLLLASTAEAIYGVALDGGCIFCNPSCAGLLGYRDAGELLGRDITQLAFQPGPDGAADTDFHHQVVQAVRDGHEFHVPDLELHRRDGSAFFAEFWVHPMRQDGELVGAVITFVDISDRKRIDQGLQQAQKLNAVGELAGGIAHEFNNLLMIIGGYQRKAILHAEDPESFQPEVFIKDLRQAEKATKRAGGLTQRLLMFSRKEQFENTIVDLAEHLTGVERWLRPLLGERHELGLDIAVDEICAELDPDQLTQGIVNLVINARDAMPGGGRVVVGVNRVELEAGSLVAQGGNVSPGRYAAVSVKDQGTGMDEETLRRIFEPFFTTKAPGNGTGLGLPMVYGFAKQSKGYIDVESAVGQGSVFTLYLPVTDRKPAVIAPLDNDLPKARGEVILLVEDEEPLRTLLTDNLASLGYTVLAAEDGPVALETEEEYDGKIDLLLSDVVMPSFGGIEIAHALRETRPETKVILMSGYPRHGASREASVPEDITFLPKPVDPNMLARTIRRELDPSDAEPAGDGARQFNGSVPGHDQLD